MRDRNLVLPVLIGRRAEECPDRVFIEEVDGRSLTWREFHSVILRWAAGYRRLGVAAGDRVVTMLPSSIEACAAWLGLTWLGALEVPCNTQYRGRMLHYLLSNSGAETVVISDRYVDRLAAVAEELDGLRRVIVVGERSAVPDLPYELVMLDDFLDETELDVADVHGPGPRDLCAVLYTSGTTGPSKGVMVPWAQLYAQAAAGMPPGTLSADDAWYLPYPMHHVGGKTPVLTMALANGRVVIREVFSTPDYWADVDKHGCTSTILVDSMANFLWQQAPSEDDADHSLKNVLLAPLVPYLDEFKKRFAVRVFTAYGSCEISVPFHSDGWNTSSAMFRSCGKRRQGYPGYEVRIVDDDDYELGPGQVGQLVVRTSEPWTLNAGYFGMPMKTADAWRNGWFHTGDAFKCDEEGNYYFVDRVDDCIRRRGENVSSFEVEAEVNAHPDVAESAAIAVPSEWGEDEIKVFVVPTPSATDFSELKLIDFLMSRTPRFMVPRYVQLVDQLPRTEASLRVKKAELRQLPLDGSTWDREAAGIELPK